MNKLLAAATGFVALGSVVAASAADLPTKAPIAPAPMVAPAFNWTGVYLGINGGWGWGHQDWLDNTGATSVSFRPDGGIFGGQLGFRYQWNQLVLGVEGTWDWADIKDTLNGLGILFNEEFKVRSLYTVTGQLGWAVDRFLVYGKGGWAGASTRAELSSSFGGASNSQTVNGWTVGVGIDYAVWQNLILGVEYDHFDFDFGPFTAPFSTGGNPWVVTNTSRLTVDQVVARLSYKFDWR
ncbi:MAG TPA: outer membrane protein [Pseudolabrys sp.]|nr:outer membrane protein [Pseudolabrys sp.]